MKIDIEFNSGAQLPMHAIPELASLAEEIGFACAWAGEANNKDPTVMMAAIAAVTEKIEIGSAVYHMLGRTPATLALQVLGLDELSRGRFRLGLGISNPTIAQWHGVPMDRPLKRIEEYLEIVLRALRREKLSFAGEFYQSHGFKAAFSPSSAVVPLYIAAFGPRMSRLAGRLSDGVLINMANEAEVTRIAEQAREGAASAGKSAAAVEVICKIRCALAADRTSARTGLTQVLTYYALADYYRDLLTRMGFGAEVEAIRAAWRTHGFEAARREITDRLFDALPVVAAESVDAVLDKVDAYAKAGATRVILPYVPCSSDAVGETRRFIRAFSGRL